MLSDDRLAELIEVMRHANQVNRSLKASSKAEEESNKYWVQYNEDVALALTELQEARKLLRAAMPHVRTCYGPTHHEGCACSMKRRIEAAVKP